MQNLIGVHAGVWGFEWNPSSAKRAISAAAEIGYDYIEIPAVDRDVIDPSVTRNLLEKSQIGATVSLALDFESDINTTNTQSSSRGEYRLMQAVEFAKEIGSTFVGGVIFSAMGRYLNLPTPAGRENSLSVLRRVSRHAESYGISLGVEYVNRYESNLLNNAKQALQFIEELDATNIVLHLDTFHAHIEEADVTDPIRLAGNKLGYIHASESHRGRLGTGSIDWSRFMQVLVEEQNNAPVTLETFSPAIITQQEAVEIGLWSTMWADSDQVASESYDLITGHLQNAQQTLLTLK